MTPRMTRCVRAVLFMTLKCANLKFCETFSQLYNGGRNSAILYFVIDYFVIDKEHQTKEHTYVQRIELFF